MPQSAMPNIPGMGAMTDTLDFVKNLWGGMSIPGMSIPGMVMPTLSVEEINKQIADLKAVESWLTVNMNMLRGTIQALEVQSATISTLQAMSETLSAAVMPNADGKAAPAPAAAKGTAYSFSRGADKPAPAPAAEPKSAPEPASQSKTAPKREPAGASEPIANPAIWWNMLQDQFKQAVNTALASEKAETTATPKAAGKPAAKKAPAKKAAAPRQRKAAKPAAK